MGVFFATVRPLKNIFWFFMLKNRGLKPKDLGQFLALYPLPRLIGAIRPLPSRIGQSYGILQRSLKLGIGC